ncbi:hypothetical protein M23134_06924 [Microscilla marina ATCC 23134]|uniref:Uncharacterized protein n=1 Tax=Microscilla marina ATCC 23134 TaxID=313606 RepID=A1ZQB4_MICM2|nr:hypothetical protein M23134_06924 [Microscilla marina ATCC 23134]
MLVKCLLNVINSVIFHKKGGVCLSLFALTIPVKIQLNVIAIVYNTNRYKPLGIDASGEIPFQRQLF